jgi:hypothetical protein
MKNIYLIFISCFLCFFGHSQKYELGYYNSTTIGSLPFSKINPSFNTVNGIKINEHWRYGIGLGFEKFDKQAYLPLFINVRYNLKTKKLTPYVSLIAGYRLSLVNGFKFGCFKFGGPTTGLQVGLDQYFSKHVGITASFGYRFTSVMHKVGWFDSTGYGTYIRTYNNSPEFRFGLIFK